MYQFNQERIKKEKPFLLLGRWQGPQLVPLRSFNPSRQHNTPSQMQCECNIVAVSVSYLASTSKFIVRVLSSGGCARRAQDLYWFGQNVPTSSHRWLALPAPLMIKLVVGVTSSREREERLPYLLSGWKWWSPS
jgi:hypothetical protein